MKKNTIKRREVDNWDDGEIEEKVEMSQHELYELIEQALEKGTDKKETNKLITEYNTKYDKIWSLIK